MLQDAADTVVAWQGALTTLPLAVLRILAWLHLGFAITLACGVAGVIASLGRERRGWRGAAS